MTDTTESQADLVTGIDTNELKEEVIAVLRTIYDPEIPVNIYDLGLIYRVEVDNSSTVYIDMTLTTPNCPEAQSLPASVEEAVRGITRINDVKLELVWDPPWDKERMSEETRLLLGLF